MRVWDLEVGGTVLITKTFRDFDGTECAAGTVLVLVSRDFLPYDGGHTLYFDGGRIIRLGENEPDNAVVLDDADDEYWELVGAPR